MRINGKQIVLLSFLFILTLNFSVLGNNASSTFKLAEKFYKDSLFEHAVEQYQIYLTMDGRKEQLEATAHYKIASCYFSMKKYSSAMEAFNKYIKLYPGELEIVDAMYYLAVSEKELKMYKNAAGHFNSIYIRFNANRRAASALFSAAHCYELDSNEEKAIELYNSYIKRYGKGAEVELAYIALLRCYINKKDYKEAQRVLTTAEKRNSKDKKFLIKRLYYKALIHEYEGQISKAMEDFQKILTLDKNVKYDEKESVYRKYITFTISQKQYAQAHEVYKKLIALFEERSETVPVELLQQYGENCKNAGLYTDAIGVYEIVLSRISNDKEKKQVHLIIAELYQLNNNLAKAVESYKEIQKDNSEPTLAYKATKNIADLYFTMKLYPNSVTEYRKYLQYPTAPQKDEIIYRIGKIYQDHYQKYSSAVREFMNLINGYPGSPHFYKGLIAAAQCQEVMKKYVDAVGNYEYVIESCPDPKLQKYAAQRKGYINEFLIKDSDAAVYAFAELVDKKGSGISEQEIRLKKADIYVKSLKDYERALNIYKEVAADPMSGQDGNVTLKIASLYEKLYRKATYENDSTKVLEYKNAAAEKYRTVLSTDTYGALHEEADYRLMQLEAPTELQYSQFIEKYPTSKYREEIYIKLAKIHENTPQGNNEHLQLAAQYYQRSLEEFPKGTYSATALLGSAKCAYLLQQYDMAEAYLSQYHNTEGVLQNDGEAFFIAGKIYFKKEEYEKAIDSFKELLLRYPVSYFAHESRYFLALAELQSKKYFNAATNFDAYITNAPEGKYQLLALYGIAKCKQYSGGIVEAKAIFKKLLNEKISPKLHGEISYELGILAEANGDAVTAVKYYTDALKTGDEERQKKLTYTVGELYMEQEKYSNAARYFKAAMPMAETEKDHLNAKLKYYSCIIMTGKSKESSKELRTFRREIKKNRNASAELTYYEALRLLDEKNYSKAESRFQYIMAKYKGSDRVDDAEYYRSLCYYYQKKDDEAVKQLEQFIKRNPTSEYAVAAFFRLGMIGYNREDYVNAGKYFTKVVVDKRTDREMRFRAANNGAFAYQKLSLWVEAAQLYKVIYDNYKERIDESSFCMKLGFCMYQVGRADEALQYFQRALATAPKKDKPEALYWIGSCYKMKGEHSTAISEFLKVPYLHSDSGRWAVTAEYEAARLYEKAGEYGKAVSLYKKVVRKDGKAGRMGKQALYYIEQIRALSNE